jgi:hypothetical protein
VIYNNRAADCNGAVFGYSMLYPYTDNFLDDPDISFESKMEFQATFERRLLGVHTSADTPNFPSGIAAFEMVSRIEKVHNRLRVPEVFLGLASINDAQTGSLFQHRENRCRSCFDYQTTRTAVGSSDATVATPKSPSTLDGKVVADEGSSTAPSKQSNIVIYEHLLEQTCYKGGTSVLADVRVFGSQTNLVARRQKIVHFSPTPAAGLKPSCARVCDIRACLSSSLSYFMFSPYFGASRRTWSTAGSRRNSLLLHLH